MLLLASDGSENALRAAEYAADLAKVVPGMKVTVLVVNDMGEKVKVDTPLESPEVFEYYQAYFEKKSQDDLRKTLAVFDKHGCRAEGVIKVGDPTEEILGLAREGGFSQIVIGGRGKGRMTGVVLGSVSSKLVQLATCPVTVVK
jgi:nucleotide-binding universal stress UspA family protein